MGAAGLTSSAVEMAARGGVGIELDLDAVPQRETAMTAYEMMLSESQERMLMVLHPGREAAARAVFDKWGLDIAVIGRTTDTGRIVVRHRGNIEADIPLLALDRDAPLYDRPRRTPVPAPALDDRDCPAPADIGGALLAMLGSPDLCSRRWIFEQYDSTIMGDTVTGPGGDAAVVRVHGSAKALALSVDVTPRYVAADPFAGGAQAVAECWRNLTAVGARPLALTDCLNFGNPENPEVMGQFAAAIEGMAAAATALDFPVVSGNVSLYNETAGRAIKPTPTVGGVGLLDDLTRRAGIGLIADGDKLVLIGETTGHLGQSIYLQVIAGRQAGAAPPVDLAAERRHGDLVRGLIQAGAVNAAHDVSDGGLLVAVAEMALAGGRGAAIRLPRGDLAPHAVLFGEDQARYVVAVPEGGAGEVLAAARAAGVAARLLGTVGGGDLTVEGLVTISLANLRDAHETWLPRAMTGAGREPDGA
jgi:phosphoribosylformylglycinamidine synthase